MEIISTVGPNLAWACRAVAPYIASATGAINSFGVAVYNSQAAGQVIGFIATPAGAGTLGIAAALIILVGLALYLHNRTPEARDEDLVVRDAVSPVRTPEATFPRRIKSGKKSFRGKPMNFGASTIASGDEAAQAYKKINPRASTYTLKAIIKGTFDFDTSNGKIVQTGKRF